jgi:hypothetical protein
MSWHILRRKTCGFLQSLRDSISESHKSHQVLSELV